MIRNVQEEHCQNLSPSVINILELQAVLFGLRSLCVDVLDIHILIRSDNTTTVAHIYHMGGTQSRECNAVALGIWDWTVQCNIWLSATHIEGKLNVLADTKSEFF